MRHVVVIGGGIAGTGAALAAAGRGARVTLLLGGTGASVLAGGAIDETPWEELATGAPALRMARRAREVLDVLGGYVVRDSAALVATTTGLVRPARGVDGALLDLGRLDRRTVLVAGGAHGSWDSEALSRAWSASPHADEHGLSFLASEAALVRHTDEADLDDRALAARHDDPDRLAWLAARLMDIRERLGREIGGVIVPPWLGVSRERATALTELVGVPCGEPLAGLAGPSGLRFEHARDRALAAAGVAVVVARATEVHHDRDDEEARAFRVSLESQGGDATPLFAHAVVLATGGLIGGGIEYTPAGSYEGAVLPDTPRPLLRATILAPTTLGAFGRMLEDAASQFGASPETHAWPFASTPLLDHAGVLIDDDGCVALGPRGLFAAGELAAGPRHTWLAALTIGVRAGDAAVTG